MFSQTFAEDKKWKINVIFTFNMQKNSFLSISYQSNIKKGYVPNKLPEFYNVAIRKSKFLLKIPVANNLLLKYAA
jgi:hypothetical protein